MKLKRLLALILLFLLAACRPDAASPADFVPLQAAHRAELTYAVLTEAAYLADGPVDNAYLAPPAGALPAEHVFEGTLSIPQFEMAHQTHGGGLPQGNHAFFPEMTVDFFTYETYLVPAARDIVRGDGRGSYWNVVFSPGSIWSESGDQGHSRASFLFVQVGDDYNEARND